MIDEHNLENELEQLPMSHRIAFVASCCERFLPMYLAFHKLESWGDYEKLRHYLDVVWEFTSESDIDDEFELLVEECEELIPDSEDFGGIYGSGAQNAAICICNALKFCITKETELVVGVASLCYEAVYSYLFEVCSPYLDYHSVDPAFEKWIETAPLLLAEIDKQNQDINQLKSVGSLDADFVKRLRKSSDFLGLNPLKRGLVK